MKTSFLSKLLALLAFAATTASAQNISWSAASGAAKTPIGKKVAFFIWHVGNTVTLVTTGTTTKGYADTGEIILTGGKISGLKRLKLEAADKVSVDKTGTIINFHFTTAKGTDGISFTIKNGTQLKLEAAHIGSEATNLIFYGKNATAASSNPVYFNLSK